MDPAVGIHARILKTGRATDGLRIGLSAAAETHRARLTAGQRMARGRRRSRRFEQNGPAAAVKSLPLPQTPAVLPQFEGQVRAMLCRGARRSSRVSRCGGPSDGCAGDGEAGRGMVMG